MNDTWLTRHWRPMCGFVYLLICLTDFVFMPAYYEYANSRFTPKEIFTLASQFKDPVAQVEAIKSIHDVRAWKPLTLDQSGLIHVSFGTILGVAAWSRGREKISSDQVTIATVNSTSTAPQQ